MFDFVDIEEKIDKFLEELPCQSEMPMPPIKVEKEDLNYATMLLDAYSSSSDSEIQAISQYIYHSHTISNSTISNALMCIALVEMRHFDVLGELIVKLGGKPIYENSNMKFWNAGNISYVDKNVIYHKEGNGKEKDIIKQKLQKDIIGEENAIKNYKFLLESIKDKYIQDIIVKIIMDEQTHIKIFQGLINKYLIT